MPNINEYLHGLRTYDWVRAKTVLTLQSDGTFFRESSFYRTSSHHDGLLTLPSMERYHGVGRKYADAAGCELALLNEIQVWSDLFPHFDQALMAKIAASPCDNFQSIHDLVTDTGKLDVPSDSAVQRIHANSGAFEQLIEWHMPGLSDEPRKMNDEEAMLFLLAEYLMGRVFSLSRNWFTGTPTTNNSTISGLRTDVVTFTEFLEDSAPEPTWKEKLLQYTAGQEDHLVGTGSLMRCAEEVGFQGTDGTKIVSATITPSICDVSTCGTKFEARQSISEKKQAIKHRQWGIHAKITCRALPKWHFALALFALVGLVLPPLLSALWSGASPYEPSISIFHAKSDCFFLCDIVSYYEAAGRWLKPTKDWIAICMAIVLPFAIFLLGEVWGRRFIGRFFVAHLTFVVLFVATQEKIYAATSNGIPMILVASTYAIWQLRQAGSIRRSSVGLPQHRPLAS
jgi:hypothetical protein